MTLAEQIQRTVREAPRPDRNRSLARLYASWGWHVFPLARGSKLPASRRDLGIPKGEPAGCSIATTNTSTIERWWSEHPDYGIGIACGPSGLAVLDPDLYKTGAAETWAELSADLGMLATFTVKTPSGGLHFYTSCNGFEIASRNDWRPGVDCKAIGGYVVAPGVEIGGKRYEPDSPYDVADLPDTWAAVLPKAGGETPAEPPGKTTAETSTYTVMRDMAYDMVRRNVPVEEIRRACLAYSKVAGRDQRHPQGWRRDVEHAIESAAGKVAAGAKDEPEIRELRALDLSAEPEPVPWMLRDYIVKGAYHVLGGLGKQGKSWVALHTAVALAAGLRWLDRCGVQGGPFRVLYLDEEMGEHLVLRRIHQIGHALGLPRDEVRDLPLRYLIRNGLNLEEPGDLQSLFREVKAFKSDVIIFDTLGRIHRSNENEAGPMRDLYATAFRVLMEHYGQTLIGVAHMNKPTRGGNKRDSFDLSRIRGSSELVNAADLILGVNVSNGNRTLHNLGGRFGAEGDPIGVSINDTEDGLGVIVRADDVAPEAQQADRLPRSSEKILMYLVGCGDQEQGIHVIASQTGLSKNTVRAHLSDHLAPRNLVERDDSGRYPVYRAVLSSAQPELSSGDPE